jgi:ribosomal protein L11 methyltransferase
MSWLELSVPASADDANAVTEALEALGASAVTVRPDQGTDILEPAPGAQPLAQRNTVTGLFAGTESGEALLFALGQAVGVEHTGAARVKVLADANWEQAWRQRAVAREFGDGLWVLPEDAPQPTRARAVLRLDPGLAFGTGAHPSTALCLSWLAALELQGRTVVDFGCGSGILAIAAALLGARQVYAVDYDPQALIATAANAERNRVADRVKVTASPPECHVLVANILANALTQLAPRLTALVGADGCIGLSGVLTEQAPDLIRCYSGSFTMEPPREEDGWLLLTGRKVTSCT